MRKLASSVSLILGAVGLLGAPAAAGTHLSAKEIKHVVSSHADEVKRCYVRFAMHQDSAEGRVTLGFVVTPEGQVKAKTIEVKAPGVRGRRFPRCVTHAVKDWEFPQAQGSTAVEYPFYYQHTRAPGAGPHR